MDEGKEKMQKVKKKEKFRVKSIKESQEGKGF